MSQDKKDLAIIAALGSLVAAITDFATSKKLKDIHIIAAVFSSGLLLFAATE
jgi:hypothetical protein